MPRLLRRSRENELVRFGPRLGTHRGDFRDVQRHEPSGHSRRILVLHRADGPRARADRRHTQPRPHADPYAGRHDQVTIGAVLLGSLAWAFIALGAAPVMSARAELLMMALSIGAFALVCRP